MTDEMILKKAIEKAVKGGYGKHLAKAWLKSITPNSREYFVLIFSHSFAKAFWGKKEVWKVDIDPLYQKLHQKNPSFEGGNFRVAERAWEYHLQQMVLEENPICYLKKFL